MQNEITNENTQESEFDVDQLILALYDCDQDTWDTIEDIRRFARTEPENFTTSKPLFEALDLLVYGRFPNFVFDESGAIACRAGAFSSYCVPGRPDYHFDQTIRRAVLEKRSFCER